MHVVVCLCVCASYPLPLLRRPTDTTEGMAVRTAVACPNKRHMDVCVRFLPFLLNGWSTRHDDQKHAGEHSFETGARRQLRCTRPLHFQTLHQLTLLLEETRMLLVFFRNSPRPCSTPDDAVFDEVWIPRSHLRREPVEACCWQRKWRKCHQMMHAPSFPHHIPHADACAFRFSVYLLASVLEKIVLELSACGDHPRCDGGRVQMPSIGSDGKSTPPGQQSICSKCNRNFRR